MELKIRIKSNRSAVTALYLNCGFDEVTWSAMLHLDKALLREPKLSSVPLFLDMHNDTEMIVFLSSTIACTRFCNERKSCH